MHVSQIHQHQHPYHNGGLALVTANMTWYNDNGTASHTHKILNSRPTGVAGGGQQQP
jgi:hypothetical protein